MEMVRLNIGKWTIPTRQNDVLRTWVRPQKTPYGCTHMVLYVTPRDVPYKRPEDVLYQRPEDVEIWRPEYVPV